MKNYSVGEKHIYNVIMIKLRANWKMLIDYKKDYALYTKLYGAESLEYMIGFTYQAIQTLYEVLEVGFFIDTERMHQALVNYRWYGRCVK